MQVDFVLKSILLAAFVAVPAAARGQVTVETWPRLVPGDTLRVWSPTPRLNGAIGALARLDARQLVVTDLWMSPSSVETSVQLSAIRRLEVRRGKHRSPGRIIVGAAIGVAAGALVGGVLGPVLECHDSCTNQGNLEGYLGLVFGIGVGGVVGGITGGVIGARQHPRWQSVSFTPR